MHYKHSNNDDILVSMCPDFSCTQLATENTHHYTEVVCGMDLDVKVTSQLKLLHVFTDHRQRLII